MCILTINAFLAFSQKICFSELLFLAAHCITIGMVITIAECVIPIIITFQQLT